MPRQARVRSSTGVYHVMVRGVNRQKIFNENEDLQKYLYILDKTKKLEPFKLLGYCLMSNHVHLLIQEEDNNLGQVMKRIGTVYVPWFNNKYNRIGHLFQDRFKSEVVEEEAYLLTVLRYIHQNPTKAKIVKNIGDYPWSSYKTYIGEKTYPLNLVDKELITNLLGLDKKDGMERFKKYMQEPNKDKCLDDEEPKKLTDYELENIIKELINGAPPNALKHIEKSKQAQILRTLKSTEGVSIRQIVRVTGLGRYVITNA